MSNMRHRPADVRSTRRSPVRVGHPPRSRCRWLVLAAVAALVMAACGNRLDTDEILAAEQARTGAGFATASVDDSGGPAAPGAPRASSVPGGQGPSAPGASDASPAPGGAQAAPGASTDAAGADPADPAATGGQGQGQDAAAGSGCAEQLAPIKLGNVGTYSGAVGGSFIGSDVMLKVWARWVNDRGGIACHPVEVLTADDQANPANTRAIVQDMVEQKGVIAFLNLMTPLSLSGATPYLEAKGVPAIGGDAAEREWWTSPMLFPLATYVDDLYLTGPRISVARGKSKIAIFRCREAAACDVVHSVVTDPKNEEAIGYEVVYDAAVSLTQPDFTAECLSASNAGADVLWLAMDTSSMKRVARSCASQDYSPFYTTVSGAVGEPLREDANIETLVFGSGTFPFAANDTELTQEFQAALDQYAPDLPLNGSIAQAWAAGKMFEHIAAKLPATPAAGDVVSALKTVTDETLGGLIPPVTFTGELPNRPTCFFPMAAEAGKWVTPEGSRMVCP